MLDMAKMFDGKITAALALKVALDDEDREKVGALVSELGRLRGALDEFFDSGHGGPDKAYAPDCPRDAHVKCGLCTLYWATRSESEGNGES